MKACNTDKRIQVRKCIKKCHCCGNRIGDNKRSDSLFCSDECRFTHHNSMRWDRGSCSVCGLPTLVRGEHSRCFRCEWDEHCLKFKHDYSSLVDWLRENSMCFYCGEIATEKEHVMPRHTGIRTFVVPTCVECNRFASGTVFETIFDKAQHIRDKRRNKYKKIVCMPEWTDDELVELGPKMRGCVVAFQRARKIIEAQLSWDAVAVVIGE